jgi:lipoprotein-anchoring transpeptidase ErfK/SrfK
MRKLSRRDFFKASGLALSGLVAPGVSGIGIGDEEWEFIQPQPATQPLLGRTTDWTPIRVETGLNKDLAGQIRANTLIPLFEVVEGPGNNPLNNKWYRVEGGYVYSITIQPIEPYHLPEIVTDAGEWGFWAEVIVPHTTARTVPNGRLADGAATYYYSTVHHVVDVDVDGAGNVWYKLYDEAPEEPPESGWTVYPWVIARHMRRVDETEFAPVVVTSGNPAKRIEIDLAAQEVTCFENDQPVFSTMCSTGSEGFDTPRGDHHIVLKQPARHMYGDENLADPDFFDLPGVPWTIFFTTRGHAIHGTYWHSDYGRVRSHGCVNVASEASRWIYHWSTPVAPYDSDFVPGNQSNATPVIVF